MVFERKRYDMKNKTKLFYFFTIMTVIVLMSSFAAYSDTSDFTKLKDVEVGKMSIKIPENWELKHMKTKKKDDSALTDIYYTDYMKDDNCMFSFGIFDYDEEYKAYKEENPDKTLFDFLIENKENMITAILLHHFPKDIESNSLLYENDASGDASFLYGNAAGYMDEDSAMNDILKSGNYAVGCYDGTFYIIGLVNDTTKAEDIINSTDSMNKYLSLFYTLCANAKQDEEICSYISDLLASSDEINIQQLQDYLQSHDYLSDADIKKDGYGTLGKCTKKAIDAYNKKKGIVIEELTDDIIYRICIDSIVNDVYRELFIKNLNKNYNIVYDDEGNISFEYKHIYEEETESETEDVAVEPEIYSDSEELSEAEEYSTLQSEMFNFVYDNNEKANLAADAFSANKIYVFNDKISSQMFSLLNEEREKEGLPLLKMSDKATNIAKLRAGDMSDYDISTGNLPSYSTLGDMLNMYGVASNSPGENLWKTEEQTAEQIHDKFQSNSSAKKTRMNEKAKEYGCAIVENNGYYYICEVML